MENSLYDILEVIPSASAETIHAAYRSLAGRNHPDKVAGLTPELQAIATARTKEINYAYSILRDADRRASYDKELRERENLLPQQKDLAAAQPSTGSQRAAGEPWGLRLLAPPVAVLAGTAALFILPYMANGALGIVVFFMTGHARHVHDFLNPADTDAYHSGLPYLLVMWAWLFFNYMVGILAYRFGVRSGGRVAGSFGDPVAGVNGRGFLFLSFFLVIAGSELFFSTHAMAYLLGDVFVLVGAYRAEWGMR